VLAPSSLCFYSTAALERRLDGNEERFARYFYALYHCGLDERVPGGVVERREELRRQYPEKAIEVGSHFVLHGEAAYQALGGYYRALSMAATLSEPMRAYFGERLTAVTEAHRQSQSLPVPMDLTEGQLANDDRLEFLTCMALYNGQVSLGVGD
jgi:hypothetical protein